MLKRENELRLCDAVQEMYDEQREKHICPSADIEDSIQRLVLEEFGFDPWDELSLGLYRSTRARFPDDPVLKECILYIKYDRSRDTRLRIGDISPNPELITLDGKRVSMSSFAIDNRPLVLLAGSYS